MAGKIALVTGSGRGIGRAIALRLAREGADVIVNYFRNRESAEETAAAISALGRRAQLVKANVAEEDDLARLFESARAFGGLDILVNNAASGYNRPVMEQRVKGWDWTLNINARAALFAAQQAAPIMQARGGGVIVNISSIGAQRVMPEYVLVGVSKAALESLTRYLAVELAPMGIVVNAVSGGFVETEALKHFSMAQPILADPEAFAAQHIPAGRMVKPEDIAAVVAFLCTPDASMIRGQVIVVDGGLTLVS
ncbi:MAG: enoyl-[acyl-carrier-protein] reductase FabL [Candidatus Thermofonsia Clade 1 bacterium]|uniref:Enoyl-[acyl-carrier-protein] reductase FabL n=1 Tax=Candidatus Thermofonsia Clade 1 bacterium TaxID=2364210 RepID=A0A2M8PD60_9CHLR|nr:MAG: enoyl-[acyl-carrier-protein] reductase FabL [Candidatus Thermofonsia Clade 1 bacterium]RMF53354.1 MAG: enoyl-[acyl-carrier-protein] reductase FabL [Chloroflexota bacterium]